MLTAQPPVRQQIAATQLVCDALIAIVSHSGDPAGTVAALAEWRKKAEVFTKNPASQPPTLAESPVQKEVCAVWDVFNGKDWFMAVTSPLGFDAKGVHDALVAQRYAPHLNVIARHCVTEGNPVVGLISELERVRSELAACQSATQSPALADIAAERRRQMEVEGWTPEHDDAHSDGQMAVAAASYAMHAHQPERIKRITAPMYWPWAYEWFKPSTARRDLVKAGALIAAEIERLDRAEQKGGA
jgi:hypothetical protein